MKGIKCCGECAYYSMKNHKCMGGAKDPGKASDSFYADCPLDDAQPSQHGWWVKIEQNVSQFRRKCSECGGIVHAVSDFCPYCGAKMDGKDINVITKDGGAG